jgi:hypothetical protein
MGEITVPTIVVDCRLASSGTHPRRVLGLTGRCDSDLFSAAPVLPLVLLHVADTVLRVIELR